MKTALLVIDPQIIYFDKNSELHCQEIELTINNINKLIKLFEKQQREIIFIRHIHLDNGLDCGRMFDFDGKTSNEFNFKASSNEVDYIHNLYFPSKYKQIIKNRYSAFENTTLKNTLSDLAIKRVAITGFMTNFCCESTARDAHDKDYFVDFITDATGTPGTETMNQNKVRDVVAEFLVGGYSRTFTTQDYLKLLGDNHDY